ncbi:MAG TPA: Stk1 family PASTA domain-containing Ser/Thr kinase [Jiangellaceae bacterium]|nr:Stk1 family PASTA domain-containing Ser/Thr kinase [Jiangellaceae bacterium]
MDVSVSDAPVGRLVDGRYRVEAPLARGGMATVYRALDTRLERAVALKVMHPELAIDDEFVARFIGEARSAARLSHPNVVGVFDQGEDAGSVFLAMEYIEGRTLRQVLRDRGPLAPSQALDVFEPVLAALTAAHEAGIVHRDIKPENVLVGENGRVKVADFGLARALSDSGAETRGLLLGTVNYISPEQAVGEPATPRSDVYSAGIMLYELLTGEAPHSGPTDFVVVRSHIDDDVPPPSDIEPGIPPVIDNLVLRATARDPHQRFADASEFAVAAEIARELVGPSVEGLDPRESAGVSMSEALSAPRSLADLDPDDDARWHTSVMPVPRPEPESPPSRGDRSPPPGHRQRRPEARRVARRRRRWVGPLLLVVGLLLAGGVAAGAWWLGDGRYANVPALVDLTYAEAEQRADEAGLRLRQGGTEPSERIEAGRVVRTEPETGDRVLRGQYVTVITSAGAERFAVPELRGKSQEEAEELLAAANLVAEIDERYDERVDEGFVIDQGIAPGQELRAGEQVPVYVSLGREPIEIIDFTGQDAAEAERVLGEAGFDVIRAERPHDDVRPGIVISQEPRSGDGYRGDEISLVVAAERAEISVPDLRGQHVDEAERILREAGFTNIKIEERRAIFRQRIVVDQRPRPGREVKPDREITLRVR